MKLLGISFVFCFSTLIFNASAQKKTDKIKQHNNELGLEVTQLIERLLPGSDPYYYPYTDRYMLVYRRMLASGNLRFRLGGEYIYQPLSTENINTTLENLKQTTMQFSFSAGYEWRSELSKNWQFFYGVDMLVSRYANYSDANYWNGGYANGQESSRQSFGVAPIAGIRFKFNDRISLTTESNLNFTYSVQEGRRFFKPQTSGVPQLPDQVNPTNRSFATNFIAPIALFVNIRF